MNLPLKINQNDLILERNIPEGTEKVVIITYKGASLAVSPEMYESSKYRIEFIKAFGFPPPSEKKVTEGFSPNIKELLKQ